MSSMNDVSEMHKQISTHHAAPVGWLSEGGLAVRMIMYNSALRYLSRTSSSLVTYERGIWRSHLSNYFVSMPIERQKGVLRTYGGHDEDDERG
jgi:hypothetical protein